MKLDAAIDSLKEFHSTAIHLQCAKLAMYLQTEAAKTPIGHLQLLVQFISDSEKDNLKSFLLTDDERATDTTILHKAPLLILNKLNLEHNNEEGLSIDSTETRNKFIRLYFSICDIWLENNKLTALDSTSVKRFKEGFRAFQARQFLQSNDNEPILNLVVRGRYLIGEVSKDKRLNFEQKFTEATGVSVRLYLDFLFMMTPHWLVNVDAESINNHVARNIEEYHRHLNIDSSTVYKLVDTLAVRREEYPELKETLLKNIGMSADDKFSNLLPFLSKPLLRLDDSLVCLSPDFLRLKFTEGAYNIVREHIKQTNTAGLLPDLWGQAYEKYIIERLTSAFGNRVKSRIKDKSDKEALDIMIDFGEIVFLCEIKYPHWSYKARLTGMRRDFVGYINKIAKFHTDKRRRSHKIKGLGQIKMFILKYRSGDIDLDIDLSDKLLVPVLILGEEFPSDPFNMEYLNNNVSTRKCLINDAQVLPFIQLNTEEIEMMEGLIENKGYEETKKILINYALSFHKKIRPREYEKRSTSLKHDIIEEGIKINSTYLKGHIDKYTEPIRQYFKASGAGKPE